MNHLKELSHARLQFRQFLRQVRFHKLLAPCPDQVIDALLLKAALQPLPCNCRIAGAQGQKRLMGYRVSVILPRLLPAAVIDLLRIKDQSVQVKQQCLDLHIYSFLSDVISRKSPVAPQGITLGQYAERSVMGHHRRFLQAISQTIINMTDLILVALVDKAVHLLLHRK